MDFPVTFWIFLQVRVCFTVRSEFSVRSISFDFVCRITYVFRFFKKIVFFKELF